MRKRSPIMSVLLVCVVILSACNLGQDTKKTLTGIEITTEPYIVEYTEGEFFDKAGMVVEALYDDGTSEIVTKYTVSPSGALTVSDEFVTVTYEGKAVQQPITVNPLPASLVDISVTKAPDRTDYFTGEVFDKTGMIVEALYDNGTTSVITDYTILPSGALTVNNTAVLIMYEDKIAEQAITVSAVTLLSISITKAPDKTEYYEGERFDPSGMVVTGAYSNGNNLPITNYSYEPQTALTAATTQITVEYASKSAIQTVSIIAISSISIIVGPDKTIYNEGSVFQPEGMVIKAFYSDSTEKIIDEYDYSPKTSLTKSTTQITVSYAGKTAYQTITVESGSVKRGVGYNFTTNDTANPSSSMAAADMDLLMGGANGISWFYNWGNSQNMTVAAASKARNLTFFPMTWRWIDNSAETTIRNYFASNPECEYILACNEPNLEDQANLTPQEYASNANGWPRLLKIAKDLNLKIVSPAMNWGTVKAPNYSNPVEWLDAFLEQPGVSIDDISAISLHNYSGYASAVKSFVEMFKKYNKPIWMTEFCAWNKDGNLNAAFQMRYMSQTCAYFELEPMIERYAWFIPKGSDPKPINDSPYNKLLTKTNPVELTDIGTVYTNMSVCNKNMYYTAGKKIDAAQYSNNNISENIGKSGWSDTVLFRPTADTDKTAGVLDIHTFKSNMWVEYLVEVTEAGEYNLSLRYQTTSSTNMAVTLNGGSSKTTTLDSSSFTNASVNLGALSAGKYTVRLRATSGECSINWLQLNKA